MMVVLDINSRIISVLGFWVARGAMWGCIVSPRTQKDAGHGTKMSTTLLPMSYFAATYSGKLVYDRNRSCHTPVDYNNHVGGGLDRRRNLKRHGRPLKA